MIKTILEIKNMMMIMQEMINHKDKINKIIKIKKWLLKIEMAVI